MSEQGTTKEKLDIVEELEARGDDLSLRAARYIRIKLATLESTQRAYRKLCEKSVEWGRHDRPTD